MNTTDNTTNFLTELKALLKKYNAEIWVSGDAESAGASAEISIDIDNKTVLTTFDVIDYQNIEIKK